MSVEVLNESGESLDVSGVLDLARFVLGQMRIHPLAELSIIVVD